MQHIIGGPRGTQIWIGWGCAAGGSKPIRGNFSNDRYPFLGNFLKIYVDIHF